MLASLMMYARPELEAETARYWALIRAALATRGIAAPPQLTQDADEFDVWLSPDLVLSQTCGMPYRTRLAEHVALVGTPDFGLPGCQPGFYNSAAVVRVDETRSTLEEFSNARFAYNQTCSQSGYAAAFAAASAAGFWFSDRQESGAHIASAQRVADGRADIAFLDAQTWRLIERYDDFSDDIKVLMWTEPTPGLPYITAHSADATAMFDAVTDAISQLKDEDRAALDLRGFVAIPKSRYLAIPTPPESAL